MTVVGDVRMVGATLMTFLGAATGEVEELETGEGVAEYVYRGGKVRLTVEVVDGKAVLTQV